MAKYEERDATQTQILEHDNNKSAKRVLTLSPLVPEDHDDIQLTYNSSGNGINQIDTVVYRKNSTTVAAVEFTYNSDGKVTGYTRI